MPQPDMETLSNANIGAKGEELAQKWLRKRGFTILHTNWRDGRYELDIVAQKSKRLHFVEVKTRKIGGVTLPEEAMTPTKVKAFLKAARLYMNKYYVKDEVQFDLIAIDTMQSEEWQLRYIERAVEFRW